MKVLALTPDVLRRMAKHVEDTPQDARYWWASRLFAPRGIP